MRLQDGLMTAELVFAFRTWHARSMMGLQLCSSQMASDCCTSRYRFGSQQSWPIQRLLVAALSLAILIATHGSRQSLRDEEDFQLLQRFGRSCGALLSARVFTAGSEYEIQTCRNFCNQPCTKYSSLVCEHQQSD